MTLLITRSVDIFEELGCDFWKKHTDLEFFKYFCLVLGASSCNLLKRRQTALADISNLKRHLDDKWLRVFLIYFT